MDVRIDSNSLVTNAIEECILKNMNSVWKKYPDTKNLTYRFYIKTHPNKKHKHSVHMHTHLPRHDINLSANSYDLYAAIKDMKYKLSIKFEKYKKYIHH